MKKILHKKSFNFSYVISKKMLNTWYIVLLILFVEFISILERNID
jgi:hypothetical protein